MRRLRPLLLTVLVVAPVVATAAMTASLRLDRTRIAVGEAAELVIEITGAQGVGAPTIRAPDGLRLEYRGQSTQVSITNGRMSSTLTHTYAAIPSRPGSYTIGPVSVQHGSDAAQAGRVRLVVVAGQAAQTAPVDDTLRLLALVPRTRVYLHERLPLTLRLEVRGVRVTDLQYPTIATDGVTVGGFPEPNQRRERRPGGDVDVVEFATNVVPARTGRLVVGPATIQLSRVVRGRRDNFFGSLFDQRRPLTLASDPVELEVLALPTDGRPADFSGAVGRFTIQVKADPASVEAGDPVTLNVQVSGTGTLAQARPPRVAAMDGLKVYDPEEPEPVARNGARLTRRFEQVVIPERAGALTLPGLRFSFFNPEVGQYRTVRAPSIPLVVRARADAAEPAVVVGAPGTKAATPAEELGRDIVFIKDDPGTLRPVGAGLHRSAWFWLFQLAPLVAWAVVVTWDRRRAQLRADPRLARFADAGARARRALADVKQGGAPDGVARTVHVYLASKLDLPPGAVTPAAVRTRLADRGVPATVVDEAASLLEACEHDRYRPAATDGHALHGRAEALVATLERERRIIAPTALLVLLALAAVPAFADEAPKTLFFRGNALYADGRYAAAAAEWEKIRALGLESSALHYNLGNAHLRTGDRGRAVAAYERAWRLAPGDPDLAANLSFARENADPREGMSLAARVAFPLATRVSTGRLVWWATAAYWLLALAAICGRVWHPARRLARGVVLIGAVLLALFASAAAYRYVQVDAPAFAVVLRETVVRFEPTPSGTEHYAAPVGTVVRVVGEREGWLQVARRRDRLRGWVEAGAAERL